MKDGRALEGRVAIVTGAGGGIGHATALRLAAEGAAVVVVDVVPGTADATAGEIHARGGVASAATADVAREEEWIALVARAEADHGGLDVLVNNAAIIHPARVTETSAEQLRRTLDVNLAGVVFGCKHAIPAIARRGGGAIVNVASMLGLVGSPAQASYAASKGGVVLLTKQMAIDYAADRIRVNCVCPSEVDTPMHRSFVEAAPDPEAVRAALKARIPLGRVASPEEIAAAILWLASDEASYVTGVALPVDGGLTAL